MSISEYHDVYRIVKSFGRLFFNRMVILLIGFLLTNSIIAQEQSQEVVPLKPDTIKTLSQWLSKGVFGIQFRSYTMATINEAQLTDYYAQGLRMSFEYNTARWYGLSLGVASDYIVNLASSDLSRYDSLGKNYNRYEIGLFDIENPSATTNLWRLRELNVNFQTIPFKLVIGRQVMSTPFLNPQDGRLTPTAEEGIDLKIKASKKLKIEGAWLWAISPRSTANWYSIGQSIGLYPQGLNENGKKSNYKGHLRSDGIGLVGVQYEIAKGHDLQIWNYHVDKIFNTFFIQHDSKLNLGKDKSLLLGLQFTHQQALVYGGNEDSLLTYFKKRGTSNIISGRIGYQSGSFLINFNFSRITDDGRFLFPREWGKEPFYTFMRRERNEGLANVNAFTVNIGKTFSKSGLKMDLAYGYYQLPGVNDFKENKYALPSYHQVNLNIEYRFKGYFEGLNVQLLYLYKVKAAGTETYNDYKYIFNKVNMHHVDLVINYSFNTSKLKK